MNQLQEQQQSLNNKISTINSDSLSRQSKLEKQLNVNEEVVTIVDNFDTSQPPDSLTGKPPLQSRRTEYRNYDSKHNVNTTSTEEYSNNSSQEVDVQVQADSNTTTNTDTQFDSESKHKAGLTWLQKMLCYIGVAAIIFILIWILYQRIKQRLTI